jgi:hypothetical protein
MMSKTQTSSVVIRTSKTSLITDFMILLLMKVKRTQIEVAENNKKNKITAYMKAQNQDVRVTDL